MFGEYIMISLPVLFVLYIFLFCRFKVSDVVKDEMRQENWTYQGKAKLACGKCHKQSKHLLFSKNVGTPCQPNNKIVEVCLECYECPAEKAFDL